VNDSRLVFKYSHLNGMPEWAAEIPWTTEDGSQPVDIRPHELKLSNDTLFIAITVLCSIGIIFVLFLLLFNWKHKNHW
jgi:hypothetical protein